MGRGKGLRKQYGCLIKTDGYYEDVVQRARRGGFHYPALVEFKEKEAFLNDLLAAYSRDKSDLPKIWEQETGTEFKPVVRENCTACAHSPICEAKTSFELCKEVSLEYAVKTCPQCGTPLSFSRKISRGKTLSDVRLSGYPTRLHFILRAAMMCNNPDCPQKIYYGVRLPSIEASTQAGWSLRLLKSCLDLSAKGIAPRVLAEGYALKEDTVRKRINTLSEELKIVHEKRLKNKLPSAENPLRKEPIYIKGQRFWVLFDGERLYDIRPDEIVQKMNAFLHALPDGPIPASLDSPSFMAHCTFAGIGKHRTILAARVFTLLNEMSKDSSLLPDALETETRNWLFRILFDQEIPVEDLWDFANSVMWVGRKKVKQTAQRLSVYLQKNDMSIYRECLWARARPTDINAFLWEGSTQKNNSQAPFILELEHASQCSAYTAEEQISRLLYLNQAALIGQNCRRTGLSSPELDYVLPNWEDEEQLSIPYKARIGHGIKIDCLRYMLAQGLLDENNGTPILCVHQGANGQVGRACNCMTCPLGVDQIGGNNRKC